MMDHDKQDKYEIEDSTSESDSAIINCFSIDNRYRKPPKEKESDPGKLNPETKPKQKTLSGATKKFSIQVCYTHRPVCKSWRPTSSKRKAIRDVKLSKKMKKCQKKKR